MGGFGQFNDTMSQYGHLVSCMTILFKQYGAERDNGTL